MTRLPGFLMFTVLCGMVLYILACFVSGSFAIEGMSSELRQCAAIVYLFFLLGFGMYHYKMGPFEDFDKK